MTEKRLSEILEGLGIPQETQQSLSELSSEEIARIKVDRLNSVEMDAPDELCECSVCKNKGLIYKLKDVGGTLVEYATECECKQRRVFYEQAKNTGILKMLKKYTLDNYHAEEAWQKMIKDLAILYLEEFEECKHSFFVGGAVGSGKTHICTAIARELLTKGYEMTYMIWGEASSRLKALVNDRSYTEELDKYRMSELLYIDDLFKLTPTDADKRLLFDIINYRYNNELPVIISSELFITEVEEIDEAIGSRIEEMCAGFAKSIVRRDERNYRRRWKRHC